MADLENEGAASKYWNDSKMIYFGKVFVVGKSGRPHVGFIERPSRLLKIYDPANKEWYYEE